jgi:TolB-like protein/tetratricopeptide (TPR) repeat protein
MPLSPGARVGTYEIIASLGTGGMGEVYRARDPRLRRDVALKVLPPEVTREPGRLERFDREARAIAALNHPHIVTIYSTEDADGIRFLTMELVEGQTLGELIAPAGITLGRFFEIAVPLADALTAAHQKLIMHRDLKPGNVMVSHDGRVKVLDFGLARVVGDELGEEDMDTTVASVTQHGMIVGTIPYMSPEQVEGRRLDPRSDLFSLGVIFYELLTGDRPFQGASAVSVMSAILRDRPVEVSRKRAGIPDARARLIGRCLEKHPDDRVQTARDVYNELRQAQNQLSSSAAQPAHADSGSATAGSRDLLSISVAPFQARRGDDTAAALADGLRDDVTTGLARFRHFQVVSGAARYMLEGSVRTFGTTLRVTARVADAQTGVAIWADSYDRDLANGVFALQDEIASRIVATVGDQTGVLANAMAASLASVPLDQRNASELVIGYHEHGQTLRATRHADLRSALERALEREPRAAEGWACLALLYQQEHSFGFNPLPDSRTRERRAAQRAVAIDPNSQQAWVALASAHHFARDLPGLRVAAARAVSINPLNADLLAFCAIFLAAAGDHERGMELARRAVALKPHHPGWYHFSLFSVHYARGEDEDALREAKLINMPAMALANLNTIAAAGQLGRIGDASIEIDSLRNASPDLLDAPRAREAWAVWNWNRALLDRLVEGLEKALLLLGDV